MVSMNGHRCWHGYRAIRGANAELDIYIACVSSAHNVCPKGYWIAIVSTIAETQANHHLELQPGLERLGKIEEQFMVCSSQDGFPFAR
jgi:RAB protein geranylgeranyltransferase component A